MKTFSAPVLAAIASGAVAIVTLIEFDFSTVVGLNTSTWDFTWGGVTYKGAYGLGQINPISDKPGEVSGLSLELHAVSAANISMALDEVDQVQGTVCKIRTAIVDVATYTILDAPIEWVGTLDTMAIAEDGQKAIIGVTAESKAVDLLRGNPFFYSDSDQRTLNAADGSFAYVVDQIGKPIVWPTKQFFQQ